MYKSGAKCKQEMAFPQDVLLCAGGQIFEEVEVEIQDKKLKLRTPRSQLGALRVNSPKITGFVFLYGIMRYCVILYKLFGAIFIFLNLE